MAKHIRSSKHATQPLIAPSLMALSTLAMPWATHAQESKPADSLPEIVVKAKASSESAYKADKVSSPKITQPLVDTAQTISVIKKEVLHQQAATTLTEALRNTPGVTLQLGENGSTSAGDTFQMRGFAVETATFVDGIRDLGAVTRDVFNIEQIEVAKGPAGADIGRGASGGYINLVSKLPSLEDATGGTATATTASGKRLTLDANRRTGDTQAVRLNVMAQDNGVPGRDVVKNRGWAIAPSIAFGLNTPDRVYLYSQHVRQDNIPDGGVPTVGMKGFYRTLNCTESGCPPLSSGASAPTNSNRVNADAQAAINQAARVDSSNFYGTRQDYERVDADMFTLKFEHDFGGKTTLRNTTRSGQTIMNRVLTGVNVPTNANVKVGGSGTAGAAVEPDVSKWTAPLSRQGVDRVNEVLTNQTNVTSEIQTGSIKHNVSAGLEWIHERQRSNTLAAASAVQNLYAPSADLTLALPTRNGAFTDGSTNTAALYVFDTLTLTPQWLINGGVRWEEYRTRTVAQTVVTTSNQGSFPGYAVNALAPSDFSKNGHLWSWKAGALYKPTEASSVYVSAATSMLPPGGASFALVGSDSSTNNNVNLDPQKTTNLELGGKWDVLAEKLSLTAAWYRTEHRNEIALLDSTTNTYGAFGKRTVDGVEVSAIGNITKSWQVTAGVATMHTSIQQGTTGNNASGAATRWSPDFTATLWSHYILSAGWTVSGGVRYTSDQKRVVDPSLDTSTQPMPKIPAYAVVDAAASYAVNKNVTLQLNVYNLFDKEYISTLNNAGTRYIPAAPRYASLTANLQF